jgi:hypothetical protein
MFTLNFVKMSAYSLLKGNGYRFHCIISLCSEKETYSSGSSVSSR